MFSKRLIDLAQAQAISNGTFDEKVDRVIKNLTRSDELEILCAVVSDALIRCQRQNDAISTYTRVENVVKLDPITGKKSVVTMPVVPTLREPMEVVPRDAAGQLERMNTRQVEQKAWNDYQQAFTRNQRLAAFVYLKTYTVAVDGIDVPWFELTQKQRDERITALGKQVIGIEQSQKLLDAAGRLCKEFGVETLAEAEKIGNVPTQPLAVAVP